MTRRPILVAAAAGLAAGLLLSARPVQPQEVLFGAAEFYRVVLDRDRHIDDFPAPMPESPKYILTREIRSSRPRLVRVEARVSGAHSEAFIVLNGSLLNLDTPFDPRRADMRGSRVATKFPEGVVADSLIQRTLLVPAGRVLIHLEVRGLGIIRANTFEGPQVPATYMDITAL